MSHLRTFDLVWTESGLPADADPRATLGAAALADPERAALPRLTLGEPGEEPAAPGSGHDLTLFHPLGEGGMGVVWLARQASLAREVAIKRLRPGAPPQAAARLLREGALVGALEHPNIVPVHALGLDAEGQPALVMKRVQGVAWSELLRDPQHPGWPEEPGEDPVDRHLEILRSVCRALRFAHDRGVLHRDVKPDNVLVGRFGEVLLLDWGVATRLSEPDRSSVCGTPAYLAPEQLDREASLSPATDVYLLGACLHEVLLGRPPHAGRDLASVLRSVLEPAPISWPESVPTELAALVERALALDPSDRPPTVAAFERALTAYQRHRQAAALAGQAQARLRALAELLAEPEPTDLTRARAEALFYEARFGFRQALDAWPDAPGIARGLAQTLRLYAEARLSAGQAEEAAALLEPLEQLGEDTTALRQAVGRSRAERARLQALDRDQDRRVGAGRRLAALGLITLISAGATVWIVGTWTPTGGGSNHQNAFCLAVVFAVPLLVGLVLGRRWTFANRVNSGLSAGVISLVTLLTLHRAVAWWFETPIQAMFLAELMLLASSAVGASAVATWRFLWALLPYLLAAPVVALVPEAAPLAFGLGLTGGTLVAAAVTWRDGGALLSGR